VNLEVYIVSNIVCIASFLLGVYLRHFAIRQVAHLPVFFLAMLVSAILQFYAFFGFLVNWHAFVTAPNLHDIIK